MMRSSMPDQIHQGVGSLSERARGMFGGQPVRYMQDGGEAVYVPPRRGGDFDGFPTGSDLTIQISRESRDPRRFGWFKDAHFNAQTFADPYYGEYTLEGAREDVGAPPRTEPGIDFFGPRPGPEGANRFDEANIRDMIQLVQYLETVPADQLSPRDRALRDEIFRYLAGRTGM